MNECPFCGEAVEDTDNAYSSVGGWERKREQGGTNMVVLPDRKKPRYAHLNCVDARRPVVSLRQKTNPAQEALPV